MEGYDNYFAIDWSLSCIAIARLSPKSSKNAKTWMTDNLNDVREIISRFKGSKILTIEETTGSSWLYTELIESVDRIIVCDPYRNKLLLDGAKDDRIDSIKLVKLLRSGLLKEVYHASEEYVKMRKLVSSYDDLIKSIVRLKNQRSAYLRQHGLRKHEKLLEKTPIDHFVLTNIDQTLDHLSNVKEEYEYQFKQLKKRYEPIRNLTNVPGIGEKLAVKIVARVVDPRRFKKKGHFLSYCGLVKLQKITGGKVIGKRNPRYSREMKYVFKVATSTVTKGKNEYADYYRYLIEKKLYTPYNARQAVCRKIATTCWGVMKSGEKYEYRKREENVEKVFDKNNRLIRA